MKFAFFFFSLLIISCTQEIKEEINERTEVVSEKIITNNEKIINSELTFEETQDSLRALILISKPNKNLKSSILQELYIRGLVNQEDDKIKFELPFNLHGFDCGAPDCYSTDITFEIIAKEPIEFPKIIKFKLLEHGCGVEREIPENGIFELVEQSPKYVNYYSNKQKSNLVILGEKRKLYYFPDTKPNSIKVDLIDKIFDKYNEEDTNAIVPYQSTIMTTNEYENFIENE
ncbi:MAG: hypothetical protein L3J53_04420 [Proteobacteria bacterium]|nr:hypothetical protein [Pseudomonadota bacterium]